MHRLHSHSFYLYSAIVGLAIREALAGAGKHVLIPLSPSESAALNYQPWQFHLEAIRLVLFLFTIAVFYIGCGLYFDKVHPKPKDQDLSQNLEEIESIDGQPPKSPTKSYGLDFGMGLIHFLIFFAWALSITNHSRPFWGVSTFMIFLSAIFLYDLVWLMASIRLDSVQEIKMWAIVCTGVWFFGAATFFVARTWGNDVRAEEVSYIPYFAYLVIDTLELFSGRPFFLKWILRALPRNALDSAS